MTQIPKTYGSVHDNHSEHSSSSNRSTLYSILIYRFHSVRLYDSSSGRNTYGSYGPDAYIPKNQTKGYCLVSVDVDTHR